jgi:metallophosphoesterase superfamily enzyme
MSEEDLGILRAMQRGRTWIWITGNHDPAIDRRLGGSVLSEAHIRGLSLRHAPGPGRTTHEIAGHLHPAAKLTKHGHTLRRRCFIGNGRRLVLPAFGAFTGGLNVLDEAFAPVFGPDGYSVWMLGEQGLYPVPTRQLRAD